MVSKSHRTTYIGLDPTTRLRVIPNAIYSDRFESTDFSAWSNTISDGGHLTVTGQATMVGNYGYQAVVSDNNPLYLEDWNPHQEKTYNTRFYFDPNDVVISGTDVIKIYNLLDLSGAAIARINLRQLNGDYQLMADVLNDLSSWVSTQWFRVANQPHAVELDWQAATASGANNGSLTFAIDNSANYTATLTSLDNDTRAVEDIRWGVISGVGDGTRGTMFFDAFASQRTNTIGLDPNANPLPPAPDVIFGDGYESGDLSAWSSNAADNGHLSVTNQAANIGTKGLQAIIYGSSTNEMYVNDWKPWDEPYYRVRFYFDPNSITMSNGDTVEIFAAFNQNGDIVEKVELTYQSGNYQVHALSIDDTNWWWYSPWINITDTAHAIELYYHAATSNGANNGEFSLWVDGIQRVDDINLDNDLRVVDYVHLEVKLVGTPNVLGTVYFDGFKSHRNTYIGLDSSVPVPTLFSEGFELGNLTAWSGTTGDGTSLAATTSAAIVGSKGLQVTIDDNNDNFVSDSRLNNETRYRARFYFDPNNISMAELNGFTIFAVGDQARIEFRFSGGDYQVRSTINDYYMGWHYSPWVTITDGPHALELDWQAIFNTVCAKRLP